MNLDERMKEFYEFRYSTSLMRREPVIIRIDGRAFHTFTRGFKKPYDKLFMTVMQDTMKFLCEHIQGCVLGYTQSDEISLLLKDYQEIDSDAWFDYKVQKITSIAASMATLEFNRSFSSRSLDVSYELNGYYFAKEEFYNNTDEEYTDLINDLKSYELYDCFNIDNYSYFMGILEAYDKAERSGAMFDARCFNIPKEEVTNYFFWRQDDASKNSINMAARSYYSDKDLKEKSRSERQDMLHEKGINWNDYITDFKRGSCCIRVPKEMPLEDGDVLIRNKWEIDHEIPIFKGEGRDYIEKLI